MDGCCFLKYPLNFHFRLTLTLEFRFAERKKFLSHNAELMELSYSTYVFIEALVEKHRLLKKPNNLRYSGSCQPKYFSFSDYYFYYTKR